MPAETMKHCYRELPGIEADPLAVFAFARKTFPEAFFFEAAPEIGSPARFSALGFGPFEILRDRNGIAEREYQGKRELLGLPFFGALAELVERMQSTDAYPTRYLGGGVFGVIGYDSVSVLEPRLKCRGNFQAEPSGYRAEVFHARTLIIFDHADRTIHLVDGTSGGRLPELENLVRTAPPLCLRSAPKGKLDRSRLKANLGREGFAAGFQRIRNHIRNGDIFQAVLAERFEMSTTASALAIFTSLRANSAAPYHYFFPLGRRCFFGASPETLVAVDGEEVRAYPIAGTKPRGRDRQEDARLARSLRRSPKEAAEHLMLVDLARNDIGKVSEAGTVRVTEFRKLKRLPNVMHLVSRVQSRLGRQRTATDALAATFPAGTLSGAPKIRAMEILSELETTPRGLYGGAVVAFDSRGGLDSCIAIRSAEMIGERIILRAGAGIVADSRVENEYAEIAQKLGGLEAAIHGAEGSA